MVFVTLVTRALLCRVGERILDQVQDVRVCQPIKDVFARPPALDDALGAQQPQLLRNGGEPNAGGVGELGDTPLAVGQTFEEPKPGDITKRTKQRRGAFQIVVGNLGLAPTLSMLFGAARIVVRRSDLLGRSRLYGHQFTD